MVLIQCNGIQNDPRESCIWLCINDSAKILTAECRGGRSHGSIAIQTTLKVAKDEKVEIRFSGKLLESHDSKITYYEGRFIAPIEE